MLRLASVAAALALLLAAAPILAYDYINADFNVDPLGNAPRNWLIAGLSGSDKECTVVDAATEFIETSPASILQCVKFHDTNANTSNISFRRLVPQTDSGIVTVQFDVFFMQNTGAFYCRVSNNTTFTNLSSSAANIVFEGTNTWAPGGGAGKISYQRTWNTVNYSLTSPLATYDTWTWYTVKIELDCDAKTYSVYLGPKDGTLNKIIDNVEWVFKGGTSPHEYVTNIAQVTVFTSTKSDGDEVVYLDNFRVQGNVPPVVSSKVAEARLADKGSVITMYDQLVTAGTDQLGSFFYIQDNAAGGAGIRVRWPGAVHEGDKVDISGSLGQNSDNGSAVNHNGEREINGDVITVKSSDNPVPLPVYIPNSNVGGGWLGPDEVAGNITEPRLKGVWPCNTYGDISAYDASKNSASPLFNTGTLVAVAGVVTQMCKDYADTTPSIKSNDFYIYDGSNMGASDRAHDTKYADYDGWSVVDSAANPIIDESTHPAGIRIRVPAGLGTQLPANLSAGDYVTVIGIAGAISNTELVSNQSIRNIRLVRLRKVSDINIITDAP